MLTEQIPKVTESGGDPSDPRLVQLRRVLESQALRPSEVARRLLEYLGRKAIDGDTGDLKEYTVGVEAFGKAEGYDPKTDSSVRVQAGKLRQKLDEYYRTEGTADPYVIDLPKGHFQLTFRSRLGEAEPPPVAAAPVAPARSSRLAWTIACLSGLIAIAAVTYGLTGRERDPLIARYRDPAVVEIWRPFLEDSRPAIISLGLPLFAKASNSFFRNPSLNDWDKLSASPVFQEFEKMMGARAAPAYSYTGAGEAAAAFELSRLFLAGHKDLGLVLSHAVTWDAIERNNVIFVGPPKYNLQVPDLPVRPDFAIEHGRVMNLHPRAGEPGSYGEVWVSGTVEQGHALISRLPGLHGAGAIMNLAATSTEGTRAAVEYVSRPDYASRLVAALRGKDGRVPKYFQAVVRAQFKSHVPIQVELVTAHALAN